MTRRRLLGLAAAAAAVPLLRPVCPIHAHAAAQRDLRFRALRHGSSIGEHTVTFRSDGDRVTVETRVEITVKVLFVTAFRFRHEAKEVWQSDRLVSVKSTTDDNGTLLRVFGNAVADGFRITGEDGPFLASAHLMTSNAPPYYAGSVFYDSEGRWVKGLLELKGERVEYALTT